MSLRSLTRLCRVRVPARLLARSTRARAAVRRGMATGWTINTHDNRTAYVGTDSKEGMTNAYRYRNRAVVVSGGASGIGKQCVREFAWEGAHVAIVDTDAAKGKALEAELNGRNERAVFYHTDVSDTAALTRAIDDFAARNSGQLHTLVNNAVYFGSKGLDASAADFARSFGVNTIPAAVATNAARKYMVAAIGGGGPRAASCSVVNMCSISAHAAQINRWTYAASKGALLMMTRTMALDLGATGIRVNSVSPAWIWSPVQYDAVRDGGKAAKLPAFERFHMLRRVGEAREVARAVLFLSSPDASFITGTDLPVDGGYLSLGPEGLGLDSVFVDRNEK